nr:hypothetical protein [Tanacetum cinerariifolium]
MNCHVATTSLLIRSHKHALSDPYWKNDMVDEYDALISNITSALVPRSANVNVVRSISQQQRIDCDENFSPVVNPGTIHTVLSLAVSQDWPIHQPDVKNAFLYSHLSEIVYMHQPPGFVDSCHHDYVYHLQRSLQWQSKTKKRNTKESKRNIQLSSSSIDDSSLNEDARDFESNLELVGASLRITLDGKPTRSRNDGMGIKNKCSMLGNVVYNNHVDMVAIQEYLTFTRSDLSYAGQQVRLYMHDPHDTHFTALKRILCYVHGTIDYGLQLHVSSTAQLTSYTDVDWAGCPVTRRSTSSYCVFLGENLLSWSAKHQVTLSCSSDEAEYRGVANVVVQHQRTKHIEIDIHLLCDFVAKGKVCVLHVPLRF